ncbi:MAG: hypothetical protein M1133_09110 [Armatimonadetes bacterium]|nr:hypothetical protein [Armatimonadota bacterium]
MNTRVKTLFLVIAILVSLTAVVSYGSLLGDVAKVGGVGIIVDKFGSQINKFVNTLTANKNVGTQQATKVVPIISFGGGGYIGAAQVIGTKGNVAKCKAVVQIEGNAVFGRNIRAKALVPVGSKTTSNIKRIYGVGVSAIIDIRI